ncbi:hypothetical protein D7V86_03840 [bacterium D16-51]|nr:hypothetical protein D7V96_00080 [bacterium D16-59]RKI61931.1 hypothetical protein D7V86_03840 [bacterium D16-51]
MFSREIVESDKFLDLPLSAQGLYLHICMEADDDGFVNNANRIRRLVDASEQDYLVLFSSGYLLQMENSLVVVAHWRICNTIRKDRYRPTVYQSEYKKLKICDNLYTLDSKGDKLPEPIISAPAENGVQKFDEFWEAYPRKEHRALAEQEYAMLIMQGISEDMLISSAKAYARDKQDTELKYINCPDTWLHKGIYTDYEVKENALEPELMGQEDDEPGINLWDKED